MGKNRQTTEGGEGEMTEKDFDLLEEYGIKNRADYPNRLKEMNEKKLDVLKELSRDIMKKLEEKNVSIDEMQTVLALVKVSYSFLYR